jgi:hypothetical protein
LVERVLAKHKVVGSKPITRSINSPIEPRFFCDLWPVVLSSLSETSAQVKAARAADKPAPPELHRVLDAERPRAESTAER